MTEEIIINDVDVAGCEHFKINRGFNCYKGYNCTDKECSDCYYKKLIRLVQENKELKEINTALIQEAEDVAEARMEICNQCGNKDDYNIPCKMIRDLDYGLNTTIKERDTYRSALEEIMGMFLNQVAWVGQLTNFEEEIYNKINEVLGNEKM